MIVMNDRTVRCVAGHGTIVNMAQMKCQMLATREAEECSRRYQYKFVEVLVHGLGSQGVVPVHKLSAATRLFYLSFSTFFISSTQESLELSRREAEYPQEPAWQDQAAILWLAMGGVEHS